MRWFVAEDSCCGLWKIQYELIEYYYFESLFYVHTDETIKRLKLICGFSWMLEWSMEIRKNDQNYFLIFVFFCGKSNVDRSFECCLTEFWGWMNYSNQICQANSFTQSSTEMKTWLKKIWSMSRWSLCCALHYTFEWKNWTNIVTLFHIEWHFTTELKIQSDMTLVSRMTCIHQIVIENFPKYPKINNVNNIFRYSTKL